MNRLIFGLLRPKKQILGSDIAGEWRPSAETCGSSSRVMKVFRDLSGTWGGFAGYVCARETALARKAPGMTFEQAAAIPQAAMLAVQGLDDIGAAANRSESF